MLFGFFLASFMRALQTGTHLPQRFKTVPLLILFLHSLTQQMALKEPGVMQVTFCRHPLLCCWLFSNNSNSSGSPVWTLSPFPVGEHLLLSPYSGKSGETAPKAGYRAVCNVYIHFTAERSFLVTFLSHKTFSCVLGLAQPSCPAISMDPTQVCAMEGTYISHNRNPCNARVSWVAV